MIELQSIGSVCRVDKNGVFLNDSSLERVHPTFRPVVEELTERIADGFGDRIHSVYLRGSLPRGLGVEGISDIDLLVVTHQPLTDKTKSRLQALDTDLHPLINGVEFAVCTLNELLEPRRFHLISFMIKVYGVHLYGENLQPVLPDFRPDAELARDHIASISDQIVLAVSDLKGNEDPDDVMDCCTWIMKLIIRCGMAFVIEEERTYTRDLYPAYQLFSSHYPEKEMKMRQAVEYAINPVRDPGEVIRFLNGFGDWMVKEAERWLVVHSEEQDQ
ncbi:nucleotidyltransferase domain-containing protein [Rossellomorea marisflavi]|uniref:nucleotidyltransferase domain-containing protein n=1 Tax=Rossellomorea marisflavi TaxID=189381 RepID=UPI0025B21040|nr:nucleotidyltransferase domain-containing protein [Rossellomorea marisflavi]WJV17919.1 nucleotidyltransferase domain-containing protein [Rossellomorea marisflavi]